MYVRTGDAVRCVASLPPLSGSGRARAVAATPTEGDRDDRRGEARGGAPRGNADTSTSTLVPGCTTLVAPFVSGTLLPPSQTVERDDLVSREE